MDESGAPRASRSVNLVVPFINQPVWKIAQNPTSNRDSALVLKLHHVES